MWLETEPARQSQLATTARAVSGPRPGTGALPSWLTLEVALYACLLVAAAALRLSELGNAVLSPSEGERALAAWNVGQGLAVDVAGGPTLIYGTGILFFLFGANDTVARLVPAIAGLWLVTWPYFVRKELGRTAALFTSLLFAVSPSLVWASRVVSGESIVLALTSAAILGWLRFREQGGKIALVATGVPAGLALASGPAAYALLVPLAFTAGVLATSGPGDANGRTVSRGTWRWLLGSGAAALVVASTGLGTNPGGLQRGVIDAAAAALSGGGFIELARSFFIGGALIYELAPLAFALLALVVCREWNAFLWGALVLAIASVGLYTLAPAGGVERLALVAVPLAVAGGQGLGRLWELATDSVSAREAGLFVGLSWPALGLWGTVAGYLALPFSTLNPFFLAAPALFVVLVTALWAYWRGVRSAAYGLAALVTLVLLAGGLHTGVNLAFYTGGNPSEPMAAATVSGDLRNLLDEVNAHTAVMQTPGRHDLPLAVSASLEQPFAWYFREYTRATYGEPVGKPTLAVTMAGESPPAGNYRYKKYVWRMASEQAPVNLAQFWRWLVYREFPGTQVAQQAILYVAVQQAN